MFRIFAVCCVAICIFVSTSYSEILGSKTNENEHLILQSEISGTWNDFFESWKNVRLSGTVKAKVDLTEVVVIGFINGEKLVFDERLGSLSKGETKKYTIRDPLIFRDDLRTWRTNVNYKFKKEPDDTDVSPKVEEKQPTHDGICRAGGIIPVNGECTVSETAFVFSVDRTSATLTDGRIRLRSGTSIQNLGRIGNLDFPFVARRRNDGSWIIERVGNDQTPQVVTPEKNNAEDLDVSGDGRIDIVDLRLIVNNFGKKGKRNADVNNDNIVDIKDLIAVAEVLQKELVENAPAAPQLTLQKKSFIPWASLKK